MIILLLTYLNLLTCLWYHILSYSTKYALNSNKAFVENVSSKMSGEK